jgi:hypothetical protein
MRILPFDKCWHLQRQFLRPQPQSEPRPLISNNDNTAAILSALFHVSASGIIRNFSKRYTPCGEHHTLVWVPWGWGREKLEWNNYSHEDVATRNKHVFCSLEMEGSCVAMHNSVSPPSSLTGPLAELHFRPCWSDLLEVYAWLFECLFPWIHTVRGLDQTLLRGFLWDARLGFV